MVSFNLVDEDWIPCRLADGTVARLGLAAALDRSGEVREVVHPSPLVTCALHRLLLAVVHRNFGPARLDDWEVIWRAGRWDQAALRGYWDRCRGRFDLFDEARPFYQVAGLDIERYGAPISRLVHEMASGHNATLFDHTQDAAARPLEPAAAACYLVAHQAFALGGRITFGEGEKEHGSADAAPLARGAVCVVTGENLFRTLILNLVRYSRADEVPFPFNPREEDLPAWERDAPTAPRDREPNGYVDLLTWQSRRVRLAPERFPNGGVGVRRAVVMKGEQFPNRDRFYEQETMLAFRHRPKAPKGQSPWDVVGFSEERALWRDSLSLLQSTGAEHARPKTVSWVAELVLAGKLPEDSRFPLELYGLAGDQAKVLLWRHERLPVAAAYLRDELLVATLRECLDWAREVAMLLGPGFMPDPRSPDGRSPRPGQRLAHLLARSSRDETIRAVLDELAIAAAFWSRLDIPFRTLLQELPEDRNGGQSRWGRTVYRAALQAFDEATDRLDRSARNLEAIVRARAALRRELNRVLGAAFEEDEAA
jgi:CRISPR system Cascade subunit CasA